MRVGTEVEVSIGHRLRDYDGKCANPHGHNYRICVTADVNWIHESEKYGIAEDFSTLKELLGVILDPFDHAMMLRADDPLRPILEDEGSKTVIFSGNPTAENFAIFIKGELMRRKPKHKWTVRVYETTKHFAEV